MTATVYFEPMKLRTSGEVHHKLLPCAASGGRAAGQEEGQVGFLCIMRL